MAFSPVASLERSADNGAVESAARPLSRRARRRHLDRAPEQGALDHGTQRRGYELRSLAPPSVDRHKTRRGLPEAEPTLGLQSRIQSGARRLVCYASLSHRAPTRFDARAASGSKPTRSWPRSPRSGSKENLRGPAGPSAASSNSRFRLVGITCTYRHNCSPIRPCILLGLVRHSDFRIAPEFDLRSCLDSR